MRARAKFLVSSDSSSRVSHDGSAVRIGELQLDLIRMCPKLAKPGVLRLAVDRRFDKQTLIAHERELALQRGGNLRGDDGRAQHPIRAERRASSRVGGV